MDSGELIELFYNRTYERFVNKQILDDKNYLVPRQQLTNYVYELVNTPFIDFIDYIKHNEIDGKLEPSDITQFSSFSTCELEMCKALLWANNPGCQYVDIGRLFPDKILSKNDAAYRMYGRHHIRAATQLGLTFEYYDYWYLSCIGYIYPDLEENVRKKLLARTITRNGLYRQMLIDVMEHDVNPEVYMNMPSERGTRKKTRNVGDFLNICLEECKRENIRTYNVIKKYEIEKDPIEVKLPHEIKENLRVYLKEVYYRDISHESTINLTKRYRQGDKKAYDILVRSNMKLVVYFAKMYYNKGVEFADLVQEGVIGLIKAIEHFNENINVSFRKYAKWWIFQAMSQTVDNLPLMVKMPPQAMRLHKKVWKYIVTIEQQQGIPPSVNDVNIDERTDFDWINYMYNLPEDLREMTILSDDLDTFENGISAIEDFENKEYNSYRVNVLLNSLDLRERSIVKSFYGIGCSPKFLEQIGKEHKLTRERVRQILFKTIKNMRDIAINNVEKNGVEGDAQQRFVKTFEEAYVGAYIEVPETKQKGLIMDVKKSGGTVNKIILRMENGCVCDFTPDGVLIPLSKRTNKKTSPEREQFLREMANLQQDALKLETSSQTPENSRKVTIQLSKRSIIDSNTFDLKTPLYKLVQLKILTKKECKHCHKKGLMTIGDVKEIIRHYKLTPDSTRFTQYTLDILFKILKLLEKSSVKEEFYPPKDDYESDKHTKHTDYFERKYVAYTQAILKLRQAKVYGKISPAKPAFLLALIEGVEEGVFLRNHFILNEWLEQRYNRLMSIYSKHPFFDYNYMTEIDKPFWHLESDGFWHLNYSGDLLKSKTPSKRWLKDNVTFAYLNDDLWILLQNKAWREKLHTFILENKLKPYQYK